MFTKEHFNAVADRLDWYKKMIEQGGGKFKRCGICKTASEECRNCLLRELDSFGSCRTPSRVKAMLSGSKKAYQARYNEIIEHFERKAGVHTLEKGTHNE